MARTQVEQTLKDELDKITEAFKTETQTLHERINALEQQGDSHTSDSGSVSSAKRQEALDKLHAWVIKGKQGPERFKAPKCRDCTHADVLDGQIMTYQSDGFPIHERAGFIYCDKMKAAMTLREAPKSICTMMTPDSDSSSDSSA